MKWCKYASGSCVWRTQSDEVIDGCKGMRRSLRICQLHVKLSQQAADVGLLGTLHLQALFHLVSLLLQASS